MMAKGRVVEEVSVVDLKGNRRTSNKGLCDLLADKHSVNRQVFQEEAPDPANDIFINTKRSLENDVELRMNAFEALMEEKRSHPNGRSDRPAQRPKQLRHQL
jgi:hypothetical protein